MKKIALLAAGVAALATAPASAAVLTTVTVFGTTTGATWNTAVDGAWAVFLQRPVGNLLNPTDNFSGSTVTSGMNNYAIFGEGFPTPGSVNSDLTYTLTLNFDDGAILSGNYTFAAAGGEFVPTAGSTTTRNGTTYTLNGFGWDRSRADNVSGFRAVSGGDPNDYTGQFSFNAVTPNAVPEPTTWAMFILGFGVMGAGMRRRNAQVRTAKASLRFA